MLNWAEFKIWGQNMLWNVFTNKKKAQEILSEYKLRISNIHNFLSTIRSHNSGFFAFLSQYLIFVDKNLRRVKKRKNLMDDKKF